MEQASREILWNISSPLNVIVMYGLFALSLLIGLSAIWRRIEIWSSGKPSPEHLGYFRERFAALTRGGLFQKRVISDRSIAVAHTLIYFGFLVLLFTTTMVFIDHDLGIRIYQGEFYLAVTLFSDLFGLGVLIGCAMAAHRRYVRRAGRLHSGSSDLLALGVLALLIVQGFLLEGLRIHATEDPWALYSPVGLLTAKFFWFLSPASTKLLHFLTWWFHTITVFAVMAVLPYTKFFHIISSPANLFFRFSKRPEGALSFPGDLEKMIEEEEDFSIGTGTLQDYSWKQLLDLDACTSCGRCQEACPAYRSGKMLSPKWLILDVRNHALALEAEGKLEQSPPLLPPPLTAIDRWFTKKMLLKGSGVNRNEKTYSYPEEFRGENKNTEKAPLQIGSELDHRIAGEVLHQDVFWSCTTCMACVEACPVGIQHVDHIVENRRNMVLMEGKIPSEAQGTLRSLETRGNPYGAPEDRVQWIQDLDVPILKAGDSVDYLYWVGCVSSYDPRKQKIARSLVKIMKAAGLSFGILGTSEGCTGDPARRLGEENLFQTLAKSNIEILESIRFEALVANCPHCFNTIKNEYPQLGNLGNGKEPEIIHHSALLKKLLNEDKIPLKNEAKKEELWTFHDPCYLGRYNDEYDAPRETLKKSSSMLNIVEMDESREKAMCCGAGGGHFWMDMKADERVNVLRINQATETGASNVATACPFCMQMMEDGAKLNGKEEEVEIRDIAEVVADQLRSE